MASFDLTEDQKLIKDTVAEFSKTELSSVARQCDEEEVVPEKMLQQAWSLGLVRAIIPKEYGGDGESRSLSTGALVAEELGYGDASLAVHLLSPFLSVIPLLVSGAEEQKKKFLPAYVDGKFQPGSLAIVEPSADFDLSSLAARAETSGEEIILNGTKCFVPLADSVDTLIVFATQSPGAGYAGIHGFLVPRKTSGIKISAKEKNMGFKALHTFEVTLKDVRLPRDARLGGERGSQYLELINASRIALSAIAVGLARAAYDYAREYAKTRVAFGEPIASRQAIAFMLAEMALEIDATRMLVWEAAWRMDKGMDASKQTYLAKRYAADMVMKVTDRAVQILGGHGYIREHPVEMWMRNGRAFACLEGIAII